MIKTKIFATIALSAFFNSYAQTTDNPPQNIVLITDDHRETTHKLDVNGANNFQIGITSNAGGVINSIVIPGQGDIVGEKADLYGRAVQATMRDAAHQDKYNPTQAGFNKRVGNIITSVKGQNDNGTLEIVPNGTIVNKKLTVGPFRMALWKADGQYDFTENEFAPDGLGGTRKVDDSYNFDNEDSDQDELEEDDSITHTMEVGSPFIFYGEYENYLLNDDGLDLGAASVVRHYYEIQYRRNPDHSLEQFRFGEFTDRKTGEILPILNTDYLGVSTDEIPNEYKKNNNYVTTYKDMTYLKCPYNARYDRSQWDPRYRFYRNAAPGSPWQREDRVAKKALKLSRAQSDQGYMITDETSATSTTGKAFALFRPLSEININSIIGREKKGRKIVYAQNRSPETEVGMNDNRVRAGETGMSLVGFNDRPAYLINPAALRDIFESYRSEIFMIYGTPRQCATAINRLKAFYASSANKISAKKNSQSDVLENTFNVYPNPSKDGSFNLKNSEPWSIYSMSGRKLDEGTGNQAKLSNPKKGMYIIRQAGAAYKVIVE
ncbi:T9SS type A sorting domain-containing protein [Algibacter sp. L3A6]|uniref:T9SS type A sorting domain-containing protein n=1 Tax=Algibacter sp. L3A6 TaxID=2686366 RepID=UPI00131CD431|nr:T9SS type A sorting domain-containing protein [Algibacter sp. L3A6]